MGKHYTVKIPPWLGSGIVVTPRDGSDEVVKIREAYYKPAHDPQPVRDSRSSIIRSTPFHHMTILIFGARTVLDFRPTLALVPRDRLLAVVRFFTRFGAISLASWVYLPFS